MAKIMLVEDDNNLREIYEARLQAEGYTLVSAKDGEEALVLAKNEKPDLVISDVMMPKISGFEMLDILRNTDGLKEVKVIMLTALGQSDDQQRADRLGADRYLVKSQVTLEDIVKVAHELLQDAPAAATATPAAPAEPVASPAAASPAPEPVAATPVAAPAEPVDPPAATATPSAPLLAPAPDSISAPVAAVTSTPEPSSTTPVTSIVSEPAQGSVAQSTADEEASVEAKIEDFVAGASSDANSPTAVATSASTPEAAASSAATTNDDKVMADAVTNLIADTEANEHPVETAPPLTVTPPAEAAVVAEPAPESPAVDTVPEPVNPGSVPIAHKKVISPLDSAPKQDINTLLALEEAKEAAAAAPAAATPVVATNEAAPAAVPPAETPQSATDTPLDPNSIAL